MNYYLYLSILKITFYKMNLILLRTENEIIIYIIKR